MIEYVKASEPLARLTPSEGKASRSAHKFDAGLSVCRANAVAQSGFAASVAESTGLFAVIDAVVLHPLPYAGADRIARVRLVTPSGQPQAAIVSADQFGALRTASTLDGAYIRDSFTKTLGGTAFPESVWTEYFSGNAPSMVGVQPLLGGCLVKARADVSPS